MRDDYYRSMCDNPAEYDRIIDWIAKNNPAASRDNLYGDGSNPEVFAAEVVHSCIRAVVYGDAGMWSCTGMCMAIRYENPSRPDDKKVILAIRL